MVAALLLTSAVTLGVAALALLSPLEHRLRGDATNTLIARVSAARSELGELPAPRTAQARAAMRARARALERRTGARVAIVDAALHPIYNPDPDLPDRFDDVRRALREGHTVHDVLAGEIRVAMPIRIGGRHYAVALRRPLTEVAAAKRVVAHALVPAALVGLAVALGLGVALATGMLARLSRLRDAAVAMEPGGQTPPPHDRRADEIGDLARALEAMQTRLRRQEAARREFVATASHELRTPLASLLAMLELLTEEVTDHGVDAETMRHDLARIRAHAMHLTRLSDDLLDLSRLDADVPLRTEPVEVGELCRAVAAEFEVPLDSEPERLSVVLAHGELWATGDPDAVARIVRILVDNAIHHGHGAPVRIETAGDGDRAVVAVQDAGPGVPPAERELIFERFRRGNHIRSGGGSGLGLAIARQLADRMGGSLVFADAEPGARFELSLPARPAP